MNNNIWVIVYGYDSDSNEEVLGYFSSEFLALDYARYFRDKHSYVYEEWSEKNPDKEWTDGDHFIRIDKERIDWVPGWEKPDSCN